MSSGESWFAERRLDYIDFRLVTASSIRRADLVRTFGVSQAQASIDLNRFIAIYPGVIAYDKSGKRYFATKGYKTLRGFTSRVVGVIGVLRGAGHPLGWE